MKTHHVCYEGTLACSGCNPCTHCLEVVRNEVLARAMRFTTEAITQSRGHGGSVAVAELDANNFWALFYGFYAKAWGDLHDAMMRDPKVVERAYDLRSIPGFTSTGRYVPPVVVAAAPAFAPLSSLASQVVIPSMAGGGATPPAVETNTPWTAPFTLHEVPDTSPSSALTEAPPPPASEGEIDPPLVTRPADIRAPIRADDIVASATILDAAPPPAPSSANGVTASASGS